MHLRAARDYLKANIMAGNATVLISDPGIGKSEMTLQLARWYRDYIKAGNPMARIGLAIQFIATANPLTATGVPWKDLKKWLHPLTGEEVTYTVTDYAVPGWFMAKCLDTGVLMPANLFDKVFLILEEWGQGSPEAKRAFAEVLRAGGTGQYYLPEGSPRVALSNMDVSDGVTKEFGFIKDRRAEGHVTGDVTIWDEDFASKPYQWQGKTWQVMPASRVWAAENPMIVMEKKPKDDSQWCTFRSFTAQDRYVQSVMELHNGTLPLDDPEFTRGCAGHCGMGQAKSYINQLRAALTLPSYQDVATDPMGTKVPAKADEQMLMVYMLAGKVGRGDIAKVLQYMDKRDANGHGMPRDMNIAFVKTLFRRGEYDLLNEPAMEAWVSKHAYLVGIITSMTR